MFEEKCNCGASIPKGYGYYNYGKPVRCFFCGRINKRNKPQHDKEVMDSIKERKEERE